MSKASHNAFGECLEDDNIMTKEEQTEHRFHHGKGDEVRSLGCPQCGGSLKIGIYRGQKISGGMKCKKCDYIVRFHGLREDPPWVAEPGSEFETTP